MSIGLPTEGLRQEHVFDIRIDFAQRLRFGPIGGGGEQGYTSVGGGTIEGPRLSGRVLPNSGADWAYVRPDGVVELNAHYLLEASDGTLIYVYNRGYVIPAKRKPDDPQAFLQPSYFRVTPTFRAPDGPHGWLSRTVIIGGGERRMNPDHSLFRYYALV